MDTATQVILGVAASEAAGCRRKLGPAATWLAAASALLPDLDFVAALGGDPWAARFAHRGLSHSLLFCALAPVALAFFAARLGAPGRFRALYLCSFVAILTHPLLDLSTSYGTRIFEPFSDARLAWHWIGIVDLVYTGLLACAIAFAAALRRRSRTGAAQAVALAGLLASSAYIGLGAVNRERALDIGRAEAERLGLRGARVEAYPLIGTVMSWRLLVETEDAFRVARLSFFTGSPPRFEVAPKATGPAVEAALSHPLVRRYVAFTLGTVRPVLTEHKGSVAVELDDMRYGFPADSPRSIWTVRAVLDHRGEVSRVDWVRRVRLGNDLLGALATLLRDMVGD